MKKNLIRTAKILGILIFILVGLLVYNMSRVYKKMQSGACSFAAGVDTIPFTMSSSGHIIVQVKMNGSARTYPFILDCGAGNFVFSNTQNQLDLPPNGYSIAVGATGSLLFPRIRKIASLSIGKASFLSLNAKETEFPGDCPNEAYGLIGTGIMPHLVWQIDFEKKIIIIASSKDKLSFSADSIVIPLGKNQFSNHLSANIQFGKNKEKHPLIIDTGNSGFIVMKEKTIVEDSVKAICRKIYGEGVRGLGKSKKNQNQIYLIDSLYFRNGSFSINKIPIQSMENGSGCLGLDFFKHYKTTISWKDNTLILEPYSQKQQFVYDDYGFRLKFDEQSSKTVIRSIIENTSAYKEKVPVNAEVVSAGDIKFTNRESLCTFQSLNIQDEYLNLVLIQNGIEKTFRLKKGPVIE